MVGNDGLDLVDLDTFTVYNNRDESICQVLKRIGYLSNISLLFRTKLGFMVYAQKADDLQAKADMSKKKKKSEDNIANDDSDFQKHYGTSLSADERTH